MQEPLAVQLDAFRWLIDQPVATGTLDQRLYLGARYLIAVQKRSASSLPPTTAFKDQPKAYQHLDTLEGYLETATEAGALWVLGIVDPCNADEVAKFVIGVQVALNKLKALGGTTPNLSAHASQPPTPSTIRLSSFRKSVAVRDSCRCIVTGKLSINLLNETYPDDSPERQAIKSMRHKLDVCTLCHAIPYSTAKAENSAALTIISRFTGIDLSNYYGTGIDRPDNGFVLSAFLHERQGLFEVGFEPQASSTRAAEKG
ncbi:hypothetical protein MNV49_003116 [Pseudohyphozyma bogoriensis]|nr:hypothetical protein MNV49_003116 [Pseudohyphozyma bogoriensis]